MPTFTGTLLRRCRFFDRSGRKGGRKLMLRKRLGLWVVSITALAIISGCSSMSDREECIIASATAGGLVGGGITTGIGLSKKNQSGNLEWMVPVGVAGGGL